MLEGNMLATADEFQQKMQAAGGTFQKDLPESLNDAAAQAARLRTILTNSGLEFAKPVNAAVTRAIQYLTNPPSQGGLGLRGKGLMGVGAGLGFVASVTGNRVGGWAGQWLSGAAGTAGGVAAGKALQQTAGVTPVFVTNWPAAMGAGSAVAGGLPGLLGAGARAGGAGGKAVGLAGLGVALAPAAIGVGLGLVANRLFVLAGMIHAQNIRKEIEERLTREGVMSETNINITAPPGTRVDTDATAMDRRARTTVNRGSQVRNPWE
jgi:hypothetical protein